MIRYLAITLAIVIVFSLGTNSAFAVYETISIYTSHKSIPKGEKFVLSGELRDRNLNPIRGAEITFWEKDKTNQRQIGAAITNYLGEYYIQIVADKWDGIEKDVEIFASAGTYSVKSATITMYIEELNSFNTGAGYIGSTVTQPSSVATGMSYSISPNKASFVMGEVITIDLESGIQSGDFTITHNLIDPRGFEIDAISGVVTLAPGDTLTYTIDTNDKSIISTTGKHILRLMLAGEILDIPITIQSVAPTTSTPTTTPTTTPTITPTPLSSGTSSENFPTEYVIAGIVITVIVVGIGIALSKRKKTALVITAKTPKVQPAIVQTTPDETQFWVCPHCGDDTEYKNGKQFCGSCNVYL